MNKIFAVAVIAALSVSNTVFAANPFSDLPADHWAYDAVAKLAAEGVVDGYPNGSFRGNKTMTRYEMAQIVAKALAKGAVGTDDKLVGEFADELENLGVRVARLEKNADNVKITGNVRFSYRDKSGSVFEKQKTSYSQARLRTRLYFTGEVNDDWHYFSRLENNQQFRGKNESGDSDTSFNLAYLAGRVGNVEITAGRQALFIADGTVYDGAADGIEFRIPFGQTYIAAGVGKNAGMDVSGYEENENIYGDTYYRGEIGGTRGNLSWSANYFRVDNVKGDLGLNGKDDKIWTLGAKYKAGDVQFGATYLKGDDDVLKGLHDKKGHDTSGSSDHGWTAFVSYKGAQSSTPGTWGLLATYYDLGAPTVIEHTIGGRSNYEYYNGGFDGEGFKGYSVGGYLTVAKNMMVGVEYYNLKGKESSLKDRTLWQQLIVNF